MDIINNLNNIEDYFIIFDEFHNFSKNNIYDETNDLYKLIYNDSKKLFVSATPRIYELENNDDIDVECIFGEKLYDMSFNYAINNKLICDYILYIPVFDDDINQNDDIKFLFEIIKQHGNIKMIIYFDNSDKIIEYIDKVNIENEFYDFNINIDMITCYDKKHVRKQKLNSFNNFNGISLLCSIKILDEAIDIPLCDSILINHESKNKVRNIQRISRCL